MKADATSIALSGIAAGQKRLQGSNLLTEDFHPVRTEQSEVAEGGVQATQKRSAEPEEVSIAEEFAEQALASLQVKASARALNAAIDTLGSLLDIRR